MHYEFQTKPYQHQKDALAKGWSREGFAYLMEQGTGKSKVLLDDIAVNHEAGKVDQAMIIPYKGVYAEWATDEMMQHWPDRIPKRIHLWRGMNTAREKREWEVFLNDDSKFKFFIINIEAFQQGSKAVKAAHEFLERGRTFGAIDESSRIKSHKSARTKAMLRLAPMFDVRRILTGTVSPNDPSDVFAQFQFLRKGLLGHNSFYSFRAEYCVLRDIDVGGRKIPIVVGARNENILNKVMDQHMFRVLKNDCLDLPEKIYVTREFDMGDAQAQAYSDMKQFAMTQLEDDSVMSATEGVTLLLRLSQVASGFAVDENKELHWLDDSRINACLDIAEDTSGKIIFWCSYREPLRRLVEALQKKFGKESVVEFHGDVNTDNRRKAVDDFQHSNQVRFFVGTQQAGGMGITLTAANTVVYYSNTFNLEHRLQSEDRAHRIGQRNNVTYYDLVARGTVDKHVIKALKNKMDIASKIQGDVIKDWIQL
jgi:SNF2 family DNA or RNA helicase